MKCDWWDVWLEWTLDSAIFPVEMREDDWRQEIFWWLVFCMDGSSSFLVTPYTKNIALFFCSNILNYTLHLKEDRGYHYILVFSVFGKSCSSNQGPETGFTPPCWLYDKYSSGLLRLSSLLVTSTVSRLRTHLFCSHLPSLYIHFSSLCNPNGHFTPVLWF